MSSQQSSPPLPAPLLPLVGAGLLAASCLMIGMGDEEADLGLRRLVWIVSRLMFAGLLTLWSL